MSLLNDALRKKRSERQPADSSLNVSLPKGNNRSSRSLNLKWPILICVLVFSAATCGALFYFDHSDATPDLSAGMPSAGIEHMHSTPPLKAQAKGDPKAAPPTIATHARIASTRFIPSVMSCSSRERLATPRRRCGAVTRRQCGPPLHYTPPPATINRDSAPRGAFGGVNFRIRACIGRPRRY